MKFIVALIVFLLLGCSTSQRPTSSEKIPQPELQAWEKTIVGWIGNVQPSVAQKTVCIGDILWEGSSNDIGEELALSLPRLFSQVNSLSQVVSRSNLKKILLEMGVSRSELFERRASGPQTGKFQVADLLLHGFVFSQGRSTWVELQLLNLETSAILSGCRVDYPSRVPQQIEGDADAPLDVQFLVYGETVQGEKGDFLLQDGATLHSGDNVRVYLKANHDVYVCLFLLDSLRQVCLLYPDGGLGVARMAKEKPVYLPSRGTYYTLDNNPGPESLLLLVSQKPLENLSEIVSRLQNAIKGQKGVVTAKNIGYKGFVGFSDSGSAVAVETSQKSREMSTRVLRSYSGFVWKQITFHHK
jgi:hypothetical protein